jgi:hypothetical protein
VNREQILQQLKDERDRLTQAIAALEGASTRTYTTGRKRATGGITAAGRKRLSELMKKRWAERRRAAKAK